MATTPTIKNAVVAGPGPQPNFCLKNSTSTAVKPLKAKKKRKKPKHSRLTRGLLNTPESWVKGLRARLRGSGWR